MMSRHQPENSQKILWWLKNVYQPFFRRRPHNVLAWAVVLAGCAVSGGPIIEPYIRALVSKGFDLQVPEAPSPWVGVAIILIGLGYQLIANHYDKPGEADKDAQIVNHDQKIYELFCAKITKEWIDEFLGNVAGGHFYWHDDLIRLLEVRNFLMSSETGFLDHGLASAGEVLASAIDSFEQFLAVEFFVWPSNQTRANVKLCLQPGFNVDRGGSGSPEEWVKYQSWSKSLSDLVQKVDDAFDELTKAAHQRLGVRAIANKVAE